MAESASVPGSSGSKESAGSGPNSGSPSRFPSHPYGRRRCALTTIAIVVIVAVAGGLGSYLVLNHRGGNGVVSDGPTFYEALGSVNSSIGVAPGGPWVLSQVYGIATPVPSSPSVWGWWPLSRTLSSCQAAFNGLTIWNGTMPLFHGTFDSGTAPFWQFVFFSNATQQLLVATNVLGAVHAYAPIALSSSCAVNSQLGFEPWRSSWTFYRWAFPRDTPAMASGAWNAIGKSYVTWLGTSPTEMYYMGDVPFGSGQPYGTQTRFFTCGTVGSAGVTRGLDVFTDTYDTSVVTGWYNYTIGCTPTSNNWAALPVTMQFSNASVAAGTGTTILRQEFQLLSAAGNDSHGITSWMVNFNLTYGNGSRLPIAPSGCPAWVASVSDCAASASGWYAVLLSGGGGWQGSFGASPVGHGWNYPVIPMASNETIAVVVPSSWNVSGDTLEVTSTTSELPLTGSMTFS
jgi:hypothetical protein